MALIMLTSILSGCTSSDISSDVTDLKSIDLYLTQRVRNLILAREGEIIMNPE